MNKPDKAGEPSMEEILASIRKIIAEEPGMSGPGPELQAVNPLLKGNRSLGLRAGAASPLNDDRPPPSLDRLSDALKANAPFPAPGAGSKRAVSFDDDLADLLDEPPAGSRISAERPDLAPPVERREAIQKPPSDDRPPGTIPMRKASFYPPAGFSQSAARPVEPSGSPSRPPPAAERETLAPSLSQLPEAIETGRLETMEAAPEHSPEPADRTPRSRPYTNGEAKWEPDRDVGILQGRDNHVETGAAPAGRIPGGDGGTASAAALALDALAQGLAASSSGEAARQISRPHAEQPLISALIAQPLVPAAYDYNHHPVRTLEDAVADMLKPMLQQWLSDNMPRIIERALRVEAARGVRPHLKPPGT